MTEQEMTAEIVAAHYRLWEAAAETERRMRRRYEGAVVRASRAGVSGAVIGAACGLTRQEVSRLLVKYRDQG
jgi:CRP-like cAMP-binding protein